MANNPHMLPSDARTHGVDRLEPDLGCTVRIFRAWRSLRPQFRPKFPGTLMRILREWYQYPYPDFLQPNAEIPTNPAVVDSAYDAFAKAINSLRSKLPNSEHWHPLQYLMEQRYPADADADALNSYFVRLERLLRASPVAPTLLPRKGATNKGAPIQHPEARTVMTLICWYIARVEKEKVARGFKDDGSPTSKAARLIETTLEAMQITVPHAAIETGIRQFRNQHLDRRNFWQLLPVLPPPASIKPAA